MYLMELQISTMEPIIKYGFQFSTSFIVHMTIDDSLM